jgi:anthranilate synthase component 1
VADSIPANEERETQNKARAVLQAIATAQTLRPVAGVQARRAPGQP